MSSSTTLGRRLVAGLSRVSQNGWGSYVIAVLLVIVSAAIRWGLNPVLGQDKSPFLIFTPAVVAAALMGGPGPGLAASAFAAVVGEYFWVGDPFSLLPVSADEAIHTALFLAIGSCIAWVSGLFREARRAAEAANQAKDRCIAVLSHELRNPLTPVLVGLSMLERDRRLPEDVQADMSMMRRNINLEARLIDDLLDVNRITRGKMQVRSEVVDLHEVLRAALNTCGEQIEQKGLHVDMDLSAGDHHVSGDAGRLQQVFWNLLRNAAKFTPADGSISVRSTCENGAIRVQISDTGIGIESEALPRIFDAFEQAQAAIAHQLGGLGLGLAICKALVELHGGSIRAQSEGPGRGATFFVELQLIQPPSAPVKKTSAAVLTV